MVVTFFQARLFSCALGREEHCKQISLACVHSDSTTLGLPLLMACVLSQSTLLRLQVALQGNCLKQALGCVHFPGLSHSGSGSWVLHKGTDSVGPAFCALPRSEQLRRPGAWRARLLRLMASPAPAARFSGCTTGSLFDILSHYSLPFLKCYAFPFSAFGLCYPSMFPLHVPFELC